MTCVTGVSGSGKSSLVNEILYKHLGKGFEQGKDVFPENIRESRELSSLTR